MKYVLCMSNEYNVHNVHVMYVMCVQCVCNVCNEYIFMSTCICIYACIHIYIYINNG